MNTEKYHIFWRRFLAAIIDAIILIPAGFLEALVRRSDNIFILTTGLFITYSLAYTYSVIFHWTTGQTLGKYCMNIRVVDKTETRLLTLKQSFMRDSIYIVLEVIGFMVIAVYLIRPDFYLSDGANIEYYLEDLAMYWFLLEMATMLTNKKRRALHDFIAGSVVIRDDFWNKKPETSS